MVNLCRSFNAMSQFSLKLNNLYRFIVWVLISLLILDIVVNSFDFLWWMPQGGFNPAYGQWLQYCGLDILNICLLFSKRFKVFGLLLLFGTMAYSLSFVFHTGGANPLMWIKVYHSISNALGIFLWWVALLLSLVGLLLWWKLRNHQKHQPTEFQTRPGHHQR